MKATSQKFETCGIASMVDLQGCVSLGGKVLWPCLGDNAAKDL